MERESALHTGHRKRMKNRILEGRADSMPDHELVELILYYAIPRRDVNELAHRLVERFGTFSKVIDASYEDLLSVDGIGENSATLFRLFSCVNRRYFMESIEDIKRYNDINDIARLAVNHYVGIEKERHIAFLFDNSMHLVDSVILSDGEVNSVSVNGRMLVAHAMMHNATAVMLAHNHPGGLPKPSQNDVDVAMNMRAFLDYINIDLIDCIIVSGQYYSVTLGDYGKFEYMSPGTDTDNVETVMKVKN